MDGPIGQRTEDWLKLALLTHVRQDFSAPVNAIVGYAEILIEDAPRYGLERFTADLGKMYQVGLGLQHLIDDILDPDALAQRAGTADYDDFKGQLRHDLRTPITALKGYGEMLLEDAQEAAAGVFVDDLQKMLNTAKRLLARIDALVEFASREGAEEAPVAGPEGAAPFLATLRRIVRPQGHGSADKATGNSRILVVDDHESNRDLLSRRLAREAQHVVAVESGEAALALVERERFDLILLDLLMPSMSGYEVLERLKCDPRYGDIPVLMISALDEIESAVRCIEAGAEDYLAKPFDPVLLRARVNACLEKKRLRDREKVILQQLRIEKEKADALLLNILPKPIVARLNLGENMIADQIADATILFADLVG
ncbi:MAG: response regulator, partial [Dongiaceae bacterium]